MKPVISALLMLSCVSLFCCDKPGASQPDNGNSRSEIKVEKNIEKKVEAKKEVKAETMDARVEIFEKANHAMLDSRMNEMDFLGFSDEELASAEKLVTKKGALSPENKHNLAIIAHIKEYYWTEKRRKSYHKTLGRDKADHSYDIDDFVADLPLGISGNCFGGGISEGPPHVQFKKDGTVAGSGESNTTYEEYAGKWRVENKQLAVDFTVQVQETGDEGTTGKPKAYSFRNQQAHIIDNNKLLNSQGKLCKIHRDR